MVKYITKKWLFSSFFAIIMGSGINIYGYGSTTSSVVSNSSHTQSDDKAKLNLWKAGEIISYTSALDFGMNNCFVSNPISPKIFKRIYGKSYKKNCTVSIEELVYLKVLHYDIEGKIHLGELICHKEISSDLLNIFKALFNAHYPIEKMILIDNYSANDELSMKANNTSCFNFRKVAGSTKLSKHSTGHAVDINPLYNPYIKKRKGKMIIQPTTARKFISRIESFPYKIQKGDLCYRLFKKYGFKWGGDWNSVKDYQHFEK